ncbi:hypothetical protein MKQ68_10225 [Chitinophaga horti]|uniref:Uncharacterized protein n=1 Tax=Chitinophaga horti TaxID=2920382 RepID=A0ABY6J729_9BACT|nr:hypothetical protein [Chitinophaga horti]UYQ95475.1 hypothetical protein MKQ68_10225 [Chitinophaga horti]
MKSFLSMIAALLLTVVIFSSCSKDKDPADTDVFAGTFRGTISYSDDTKTINPVEGSVFVTKVGSRYDFRFDNGIPDLTGVQFEERDANTMVSIGDAGTGAITINKDKLQILFSRNSRNWSADCTR